MPLVEGVAAKTDQEDVKNQASPAEPRQDRTLEAVKGSDEYMCTMHPEIRTNSPGKCPKCGMTLVPVTPAVSEDFDLKLEATPPSPKPGERVHLRFSVSNPRSGRQVQEFQLMHEKLFHLFVVSQDLSEFQHIHPEYHADGSFTIDTVLPRPGAYKIYSDIYPEGGAAQVLQRSIATAGYKEDLVASEPNLQPDTALVRVVDGTKAELTLNPVKVIAGQPVELKYHLSDAKTGQPVRNLVPYLGAWGHTLILSEDQRDYVHSHPEETVEDKPDKSRLQGGPDVTFNAFIPRPGIYRIWTQFQRGTSLSTFVFTINAEELK